MLHNPPAVTSAIRLSYTGQAGPEYRQQFVELRHSGLFSSSTINFVIPHTDTFQDT
jgi:hypothetical protein